MPSQMWETLVQSNKHLNRTKGLNKGNSSDLLLGWGQESFPAFGFKLKNQLQNLAYRLSGWNLHHWFMHSEDFGRRIEL